MDDNDLSSRQQTGAAFFPERLTCRAASPNFIGVQHEEVALFFELMMRTPWDSPRSPLGLKDNLTLEEAENSEMFRDARHLLRALDEAGVVEATEKGKLNRRFVRRMFETLDIPPRTREVVEKYSKVIDEPDLGRLHRVRNVCEIEKLVSFRGKKFRITSKGREMLKDENSGKLFLRLFIGYMCRLDLSYFAPRNVPELQQAMPVTLLRLHMLAQDWMPMEGCSREILLPAAFNALEEASPELDVCWTLCAYVFDPLSRLGLIEINSEDDHTVPTNASIRVTPVWHKFFGFPCLDKTSLN